MKVQEVTDDKESGGQAVSVFVVSTLFGLFMDVLC